MAVAVKILPASVRIQAFPRDIVSERKNKEFLRGQNPSEKGFSTNAHHKHCHSDDHRPCQHPPIGTTHGADMLVHYAKGSAPLVNLWIETSTAELCANCFTQKKMRRQPEESKRNVFVSVSPSTCREGPRENDM